MIISFIIILYYFKVFTLVLANGFSGKAEWQQVPSSFQDSSHYSGLS